MYVGHARLCVCLYVSVPAAFQHYYTDPGVTWGNGRGCPLVVQCWADLQSVDGFRCYDNTNVCKLLSLFIVIYTCILPMRIAPNAKCQRVLVLALWLVCCCCYMKLSFLFAEIMVSGLFHPQNQSIEVGQHVDSRCRR